MKIEVWSLIDIFRLFNAFVLGFATTNLFWFIIGKPRLDKILKRYEDILKNYEDTHRGGDK
jgi:hypothetical protein